MIKHVSLVTLLVSLSGCASIKEVETKIEKDQASVEAIHALAESNATNGSVIRSNIQRIAGEEVLVKSTALPSIFEEKIWYATKGRQSLIETLEDISQTSGISIRTAEIADLTRNAQTGQGNETLVGNVSLEYAGTRRGLFDEIAAKGNASWRFNRVAHVVEFFRFETRTLTLNVPAGAQTIAASISLAGVSGGGGGGGSSSNGSGSSSAGGGGASAGNVAVSQNLVVDPWTSIMAGVNTILSNGKITSSTGGQGAQNQAGTATATASSGSDGSAIANQDLGLITVTARPAVLDRIARYVDSMNQRFAQNILIDAKIMTVTLNEQTAGGFTLNMLYNPINKLGASIVGPGALQAGTSSPGILTLAPTNPNSPFAGSSLVFNALSQFGKVSLQQQAQTLAVNGQPAPMQVADEYNFKSGQTITQNGNSGSIITPIQGTRVVGFTANFIPLILGDNRISLAYQLNLSSLTGKTVDPDGTEHPQISSKSLPGHAFMRDGQAIVLFGYGEQRDGIDSSLHAAGFSKAGTKARQLTVIVVQLNTGVKNEQN